MLYLTFGEGNNLDLDSFQITETGVAHHLKRPTQARPSSTQLSIHVTLTLKLEVNNVKMIQCLDLTLPPSAMGWGWSWGWGGVLGIDAVQEI